MASIPQMNQGVFVPTTDIYDSQTIYGLDVNSDEFKEFLVRLRQGINNMAIVLNLKESGYYYPQEFVCGQLYFPNPALTSSTSSNPVFRQVFRRVINFGALLNSATKSLPHGITIQSSFSFTRIYGCASDPVAKTYIPLPYVDAAGNNISIDVDATNVNITTTSNRTNYTIVYCVIEYLKQ